MADHPPKKSRSAKPPRIERSAGFVIFSERDGRRRYLLLDYGRHWDFPKGHVEPGEDDLQAAHRELQEETALTGAEVVPGFNIEIDYNFRGRDGVAIQKTVVFFLAKVGPSPIALSHEHVGYEFAEYPQAIARLTYSNARNVLEAAEARLNAADVQLA